MKKKCNEVLLFLSFAKLIQCKNVYLLACFDENAFYPYYRHFLCVYSLFSKVRILYEHSKNIRSLLSNSIESLIPY